MSSGSDYAHSVPDAARLLLALARLLRQDGLGLVETVEQGRLSSAGTPVRSSLAVVVMTRGPGRRTAALLEGVREVADEIVVALDDRAAQSVCDELAVVADRIIRYPFLEPVDRPLPWLVGACRTEWVLILDDDEVPSLALVHALPRLCADDDVVHYSIPRRWLFPTIDTYLDEPPWRPDYQLRLFRRDPRLIHFSDEFHRPIVASGPGRFLEEPLWHLDTAVRPYEERLAKTRRYEETRPGMRVGALALNFGFYLPETRSDPGLRPLPPEERLVVESVVAERVRGVERRAVVEQVSREQIDAHWPVTEGDAVDGRLELLDDPPALTAGEQRTIAVRVHNTGSASWHWGAGASPPVHVGTRWTDANGVEVETSRLWTPLPAPIRPGRSDVVPVHLLAPKEPGRYAVSVDIVRTGSRWLRSGATLTGAVSSPRRVAVIGDDRALMRVAAVVERAPEVEPVALRRTPVEGAGYRQVEDGRAYLFDATPETRLAFGLTLLWRSLHLVAAAALLARGREPGLPRGASRFLTELASCRLLVVAGLDGPDERRERWSRRLAVLSARLLGVPTVSTDDPDVVLRSLAA